MANENLNEKVSVNINSSTLSNIDLLVDNGYYSNRSDFINQAVRDALQKHQSTLDRIIETNVEKAGAGNVWFVGVYGLTGAELDAMYEAGKTVSIRGYGVFVIDNDCKEDKLLSVVKSINIKGKVFCSGAVKELYQIK